MVFLFLFCLLFEKEGVQKEVEEEDDIEKELLDDFVLIEDEYNKGEEKEEKVEVWFLLEKEKLFLVFCIFVV